LEEPGKKGKKGFEEILHLLTEGGYWHPFRRRKYELHPGKKERKPKVSFTPRGKRGDQSRPRLRGGGKGGGKNRGPLGEKKGGMLLLEAGRKSVSASTIHVQSIVRALLLFHV